MVPQAAHFELKGKYVQCIFVVWHPTLTKEQDHDIENVQNHPWESINMLGMLMPLMSVVWIHLVQEERRNVCSLA